ncbi:GntP family permease [Methylocella sp.]|uniref:GntP family permease n=1 Tax=Methylocella sp. TaxID=1978226 RepID=UPI0037839ACF
MDLLIALAALFLLMFVAYRGFSVILFAPIAAMLAVLVTDPSAVPTVFTSLFMEKMVAFLKLYFPVFLLGAVFGKAIELSGFSRAIVAAVVGLIGASRAILAIVLVCAVLTYGGVSLFVAVFAVYPFAAELFRRSDIPKRLIPGTIALGAFSFTMDALPGTPQIQNIIPSAFFHTTAWAAPVLGVVGAIFILVSGLGWLEWRRRQAAAKGEGYGAGQLNEPETEADAPLASPYVAIAPLVVVFVSNKLLTMLIASAYPGRHEVRLAGMSAPVVSDAAALTAIWAVQGALILGVLTVFALAFRPLTRKFADGSKTAVAGALLAGMNTASEYGFGAVIAALPGFVFIRDALGSIGDPLAKVAISVSTLAGVTGSASGGLSIALAAMSQQFIAAADAAHIPMAVLHRVAAMASGGMDTLPHNGAVITVLAVTGLTHRHAYADIFAVTVLKTAAVFVVIGFYYLTGLY